MPPELRVELHASAKTALSMFSARTATAMDVAYFTLFPIISAWSHETVGGKINAFVDDLYA
jgi:hypothetical protein